MREVYRARDTRLKRDVALKLLIGAAAEDPTRFQLWRAIAPPDRAGDLDIGPFVMTPDEKSYAYTIWSGLSELYIVAGLR
jgi:hypothetical protein